MGPPEPCVLVYLSTTTTEPTSQKTLNLRPVAPSLGEPAQPASTGYKSRSDYTRTRDYIMENTCDVESFRVIRPMMMMGFPLTSQRSVEFAGRKPCLGSDITQHALWFTRPFVLLSRQESITTQRTVYDKDIEAPEPKAEFARGEDFFLNI